MCICTAYIYIYLYIYIYIALCLSLGLWHNKLTHVRLSLAAALTTSMPCIVCCANITCPFWHNVRGVFHKKTAGPNRHTCISCGPIRHIWAGHPEDLAARGSPKSADRLGHKGCGRRNPTLYNNKFNVGPDAVVMWQIHTMWAGHIS